MHKLSAFACAIGLALAGACGTAAQPRDQADSLAKGQRLAFELVCMPVVLDGQDFVAAASARLMTPVEPASNPSGMAARTYRLGFTGVSATGWADGSCTVGAQEGDTAQLQAQTLASLAARGIAMTAGMSGQPAANNGVGSAYCSAEARPLVLGFATSADHALVATLYRASEPSPAVCLRS